MRTYPFALAVLLLFPGSTLAQEPEPTTAQGALLVFLDCQGMAFIHCDFDHVRREITWANWVRDRQDSDVHLLVTAQQTGGGGFHYTLDYIGRRTLEGMTDTLTYVSDPDDTRPEVRERLTQTIAVGLVQFATGTAVVEQLRISYEAPAQEVAEAAEEEDPWNLWVFRIGANGSINGESLQRGYRIGGNASANRTSEDFKFTWGAFGSYRRDEFDLDDTTTIVNTTENYSTNFLAVWSVGERWSAGGTAAVNRSTFNNRDLGVVFGPALEFNIFPYRESTRKSITFLYTVEATYFDYELETVAGKTEEIKARHRLQIGADVQQPWGQVFASVSAIQYLDDPESHRFDTFAGFSIRIIRGLNFNVNGNFSRIKDQFFLPAGGLTPEEILLRRRQRETDFRFRLNVGLSYRFGSKFANIVNPRMGGGGFFFF